ncbi:MAG TPA: M23 family metallopeptidase [Blastocatellia bacterium]|nr:M23 family metallopeptidase [Blastocatellia bacterium]
MIAGTIRGIVAALLLASLVSTATAQTQSGEQSTILSPKAVEKQKDEKKGAAQEKTPPQQNPLPQEGAATELNLVVPPAPVIVKRSPIAIVIPPEGIVNPEQVYKEGNSSPMIVQDGPQVVVIPPEKLAPGESKPELKYEQRPIISNVKIGSLYGYRSDPFTGRARFHSGVDIKARWGDPVGASHPGVVQFAGWYHGYGNLIVINHGGGVTTHYAHLSSYAVAVGTRVERGTVIGYAGSTGRATSPHLHYEVRINDNPVNPLQPLALDATSEFFNTLPSESTQKQDK